MLKYTKKMLASIPNSPGIYKMTDKKGKIIYIGKAKDLKKRVSQYFQKNYQHSTRTRKLLENLHNIEVISVDTELEALLLESNLIKQFQPKYNIIMKDDKNYVYIKITQEDFPRIQIVRKIEKDNARYYGPKTASHKVRETLKLLKKIFPFRHCNLEIGFGKNDKLIITHKTIKYPCLDYFIKRCVGPCTGKCSTKDYREIIRNIERFLEGKTGGIIKNLTQEMIRAAETKKFEKAAKIRDKIQKIKDILEKQKVSDQSREDKDVMNYCIQHNKAYFNLFQIRDGKLIGQENFILSAENIEDNNEKECREILESFIRQYYELATDIPKEILIPQKLDNQKQIEKFLDIKAEFFSPQKGTKNKLLEMSLNNARIFADRSKPGWQEENELTKEATTQLQKTLKIHAPLKRIECYDISHLGGTFTVGSMIVFENGAPNASMYRKFKIRTVKDTPDDYKCIEEVLTRRFARLAEDLKHKDHIFKKARTKDHPFIENNNNIDLKKTDRTFYILEKNKTPRGFIATKDYSDKVSELTNLWILKKERGHRLGYKLIKEAIKKTASSRVYILCEKKLEEYYMMCGFEEIRQIPIELTEREKKCEKIHKSPPICLVFDKNKHKSDKSFSRTPDLVIIDGGKGQLSSCTKVLKKLNLDIPHVSIAKKLEKIFQPKNSTPIKLAPTNEALKLLQRARDEAHRFAIKYNKTLRQKNI